MQYTENHNFKLPDGTDRFNIQNENDNWESMDTLIDEYLPLSAGPQKQLTGRLYINCINDGTEDESTGLHIQHNGVNRGTLYGYFYADGSTSSDFVSLVCRDKSGEILNGIRIFEAGNVHIGAARTADDTIGGRILLRPYGISTNTNQAYLDYDGTWHLSGQQIGGHPITTKGASKALSASTSVQDIQSFTLTPGTYILISHMDSNVSSTTTYNHIVAVGSVVNKVTRTSMGSGGGSLNGFMFTVSADTTCNVQTYVSVACTIRNTVWYTRIS